MPNEQIIEKFNKLYSEEKIRNTLEIIDTMKNHEGLFKPRIFHGVNLGIYKKEYEHNLLHKVGFITLNVSESCNLRCSYCIFDPCNKPLRNHTSKRMSWQTAKLAVDFVASRCDDAGHIGIGYYGGEPFLNFQVMKDSLSYFTERTKRIKNKQFVATVTTNGTILDEEKIRWLINNNVGILVSLDGPEHIHNKFRKYGNGTGSFKNILENLKKIRKISSSYFSKKVSFNAVLSNLKTLAEICNYFSCTDLFIKNNIRINAVDRLNSRYFLKKYCEPERHINEDYLNLYQSFLKMIEENKFSGKERDPKGKILYSLFYGNFYHLYNRQISKPVPEEHIIPCEIGVTKLFANVEGKLFPCGNVNEKIKGLCIGDVTNGFYKTKGEYVAYRRMLELINLINLQCSQCWAIRLCEKFCYNHYLASSKSTLRETDNLCEQKRRTTLSAIHDFIRMERTNPNAFDFYKKLKK